MQRAILDSCSWLSYIQAESLDETVGKVSKLSGPVIRVGLAPRGCADRHNVTSSPASPHGLEGDDSRASR